MNNDNISQLVVEIFRFVDNVLEAQAKQRWVPPNQWFHHNVGKETLAKIYVRIGRRPLHKNGKIEKMLDIATAEMHPSLVKQGYGATFMKMVEQCACSRNLTIYIENVMVPYLVLFFEKRGYEKCDNSGEIPCFYRRPQVGKL